MITRPMVCALLCPIISASAVSADTYLLAVGVSQYDRQELPSVEYADDDARLVAAAFLNAGLPEDHVITLTSDSTDRDRVSTHRNILRMLGSAANVVASDDVFMFYFAGAHGDEDVLCAKDSRSKETLLDLDSLLPFKTYATFLDSVHYDAAKVSASQFGVPYHDRGTHRYKFGVARNALPSVDGHGFATSCFVQALGGREASIDGHVLFDSAVELVKRSIAQALSPDLDPRAYADRRVPNSTVHELEYCDIRAQVYESQEAARAAVGPGYYSIESYQIQLLEKPSDVFISIDVAAEPMESVIASLSRRAQARIICDETIDVTRPVTAALVDKPLSLVLRLVTGAPTVTRTGHKLPTYYVGAVEHSQADADQQPPEAWPDYLANYNFDPQRRYRIAPIDKMPQVLVPAGECQLVLAANNKSINMRRIATTAFWVDLHEVTIQQYQAFCVATGRPMWPQPPWCKSPLEPVVNVSWTEAQAYADWAGRTLPSRAQWQRVARFGGEGLPAFSWGDEMPPPTKAGNYLDATFLRAARRTMPDLAVRQPMERYVDGFVFCSPVCSFSPNLAGVYDLDGNVAEWCEDILANGTNNHSAIGEEFWTMPDVVDPVRRGRPLETSPGSGRGKPETGPVVRLVRGGTFADASPLLEIGMGWRADWSFSSNWDWRGHLAKVEWKSYYAVPASLPVYGEHSIGFRCVSPDTEHHQDGVRECWPEG